MCCCNLNLNTDGGRQILTGVGLVVVEHQVETVLFFLGEYFSWFEACLIEKFVYDSLSPN